MKQKFFTLGYWYVFLGLILTLLLVHIGIIKQGSNIAFEIIAALIFMYMPLIMVDIFKNDQACNAFVDETKKAVQAAKQKYRRTFPPFPHRLAERGAVARDLRAVPMSRRTTAGRQHGGASTAARQSASGKSLSDDDGGDGEPPRYPILFPILFPKLPQSYTYSTLSERIPCAEKTLRNMVSLGRFPRPIQTLFGPRFSQEHLALALSEKSPHQTQPTDSTPPKRGRPRIAQMRKGGTV